MPAYLSTPCWASDGLCPCMLHALIDAVRRSCVIPAQAVSSSPEIRSGERLTGPAIGLGMLAAYMATRPFHEARDSP